jgi:hypothetical protein
MRIDGDPEIRPPCSERRGEVMTLDEKQITIAGFHWRITRITNKSYVLDNYNGTIYSGNLTAILGEIKRLEAKALPNITVERQSTCRGEFPRVCRVRDYNHERGGIPQKVMENEPVSTGAGEVVSPLPSGGPNAPAPEQSLRAGVSGCARVSGNGSGVARVPGLPVSEPHHAPAGGNGTTCPHIEEWHKLNGAIENGEVAYIQPAPISRIMPAIAEETPRQRMAKAITAAVARIPESWDDHDTIKLPYGFYLKRKGFDEAKIYHPKHQGNSIPAALYLPPWTVISPHKLRNSLDIIEGIIKRYRLAEEPEPTNPASKAA